jgi:predicted amidohydrolase
MKGSMHMATSGGGYSAIIGPDGRLVSKFLKPAEEGLVVADIDMDMSIMARSFLDICGHYSRPDLLWLGCDTKDQTRNVDAPRPLRDKEGMSFQL